MESLSLDELLGRRLNDVEKKNAPARYTRNETMALISNAAVIVEAGDGSGTVHQGREALRLGRPLFVCRTAAKARPRWLDKMMQYGAVVLEDYDDILYEIPRDFPMVNAFAQTPTHH